MDSSWQAKAARYRTEAQRVRREAANVKDEAIRRQLLEIANTYEQIAVTAETQRL
jgi:hypothetical protein